MVLKNYYLNKKWYQISDGSTDEPPHKATPEARSLQD